MKIFTSAQIHELDKYTIEHEPITSLNLMERAAKALTRAIEQEWSNRTPVVVFAGPGNNGGDALAVARLLSEDGYGVSVFLFNVHNKLSADCATNKKRLIEGKRVKQFTEVTVNFDPPQLEAGMLVVDGLFGTVRWMNSGESRISSTLILPRYCWLSAIIIDSFFCCRVRVRSARMMLALML